MTRDDAGTHGIAGAGRHTCHTPTRRKSTALIVTLPELAWQRLVKVACRKASHAIPLV